MLATAILTAWAIICYFIVRLNWLKRFQQTILLRSPVIYMSLPTLKYMMWNKFWVWEDTVFLPHPEDLRHE